MNAPVGLSPAPRLFEARRKVLPKAVKGPFRRFKWAVMSLTLLVYYVTPWLRWDRGPFAPNGWGEPELSDHASAFSVEYREHLSKDEHTAWAQGLDERNLGTLLWMVGEYAVRVRTRGPDGEEYPPPSFDADPDTTKPMRAALRLMARIAHGESITAAEADRRMAAESED